jgi:hypothetical protein
MRATRRLSMGAIVLAAVALVACDGGGAAIDAAMPIDAAAPDATRDVGTEASACAAPDTDGDGARSIACGGDDCDDADPERFPGNTEVCDAADHDEDCDALTFGERDGDGDGQADATCCNEEAGTRHCGNDCDDTRVGVHVDAPEVCNAIDDDCDTAIDEGVGIVFYEDCDGDIIGAGAPMTLCTPSSCSGHPAVTSNGDCDDTHAAVRPGGDGVCDCTPAHTYDADGDGHVTPACGGDDCEDAFAMIAPGAPGVCDCGAARTYDADGDGHFTTACGGDDCDDASASAHPGALGSCGVCPGPIVRAAELCDGLDDDCDGAVDEASASASCPLPHGTPICTAAACAVAACNAGFHECTGACVSNDDLATCGARCTPCPPPPARAIASCEGTSCGFVCDSGYAAAGAVCDVAPPRPIAPLSTATVTSRRPTLRWALTAGTDGAQVEICSDRPCATVLATLDVVGTSVVPPSDLPVGVVFWRLRSRTGATLSAAVGPAWQFTVGARTAPIDTSWGATLDVNGDGYADLVVGAAGGTTGRAYVYLGGASGLGVTPSATLIGPDDASMSFGESVASAGDVDGDGYADVIVGATYVSGNVGAAYVFLGSASGLRTTAAARILGPELPDSQFGARVASAGDVDGDGYADVIVSAYQARSQTGTAHLYLGGPSGVATTPAVSLVGPDGANGRFGSVASAGDVNGDGYGDVMIGAWGTYAGSAYLYLGGASGLATTAAVALTGPDGIIGGTFGRAVACAGDVNGDGYADVVIGTESVSAGRGRADVYLGGPTALATAPTTSLFGLDGANGYFGGAVASAGDLDADGYGDVVVGASGLNRAYAYLGGPSGLGTTASATIVGTDGPSARFAAAVAGAGDVDGNGYADLAIGAPYALSAGTGRVHVYRVDASGVPSAPALSLSGPGGMIVSFGASIW